MKNIQIQRVRYNDDSIRKESGFYFISILILCEMSECVYSSVLREA